MRRLRGQDAYFLTMERPAWPMHVGALSIVDPSGVPGWGFESVRRLLEERIPLVAEFTMKVKEVPFSLDRPLLVRDRNFRLDRHLHRIAVPSPGGPRELSEVIANLTAIPLDRRRALWEIWFIEGLADGRAAVFAKTHHVLVDGVSGAGLAEVLADLEPDPVPREVPPLPEPERVPNDVELFARGTASALTSPLRGVRWAADFANRTLRNVRTARRLGGRTAFDLAPKVPFNGVLSPLRSFAYTSLSLDDVKAAKNRHGVKVNDVVLALAAGTVRRFLLAHHGLPSQPVVASVPMSLHVAGSTERGTNLTQLYASLATHIDDPIERLHAIAKGMQSAKEIGNAIKAQEIRRLSETVIPGLANLGWRVYQQANMEATGLLPSNLIVSNVPGIPIPIYVAGARLQATYPVPPLVAGQGLNITVISYMDSVDVGFICDREMIDDAWELVDGLHESLRELLAVNAGSAP